MHADGEEGKEDDIRKYNV